MRKQTSHSKPFQTLGPLARAHGPYRWVNKPSGYYEIREMMLVNGSAIFPSISKNILFPDAVVMGDFQTI